MRRKLTAVFIGFLFFFTIGLPSTPLTSHKDSFSYYITHFLMDTGAYNGVTAIYLNYRLFDTFFETLLLLIAVIGIIYFSRHEGSY